MADRTAAPVVAVLADDLIWSTRLVAHLRRAGAEPLRASTIEELRGVLDSVSAVVVDLTAQRYDGIAALEAVRTAGVRAIAVGQHDDQALRRRALDAGAERVYAYRKLFEDGPEVFATWLQPADAPR
jgi:DNA-binding response OmpR family regulator